MGFSHLFLIAGASGPDYPTRSRVNQYPDPVAHRKDRQKERERSRHDVGHVNPAYSRHASETDSNSSDMDNRDVSPPRVRRARGGRENLAFISDSSYEDSSSMEDERVEGYTLEDETFKQDRRRSYKQSREQDILDRDKADGGRYISRSGEGRRSRRDDFKKHPPRSDSPLTIETLEKHEKITRGDRDKKGDNSKRDSFRKDKRRREPSPSQDSSLTNTGSVVTEGTEHTATTLGSRFEKNPRLRRNSPSRSSSHRRYRKDNKDSQGRSRTHRSGSGERSHQHRSGSNEGGHRDRSRSPGSTRSRRSRSSDGSGSMSRHDAKKLNKQQAVLPIFSDPKGAKKKSSMV